MLPRLHNTLIIGVGSIGERHLRCFRATERAQVSFVELREDLSRQIAERYPGVEAFSSFDAALKHPWDAAVIATPAPFHVPQAIELLRRNISVLIEKPLSIELAGTDELLTVARSSQAVAGVAYVHRANPVLADMRREFLSGRFGTPVQLVATTGQHFPTARPAYADIYYAHRNMGGGAVHDALTHIINLGEWLVGDVDQVVADLSHQALPKVNVEDTVHVLARHGGVMASYALNQYQAPTEIVVTLVCTHGTLRFEAHQCRWRFMEAPDSHWVDSPPITLERDLLFVRQANAFLDAVEGKSASLCSLEEALATLKVNLAVLASADSRQWQVLSQREH